MHMPDITKLEIENTSNSNSCSCHWKTLC